MLPLPGQPDRQAQAAWPPERSGRQLSQSLRPRTQPLLLLLLPSPNLPSGLPSRHGLLDDNLPRESRRRRHVALRTTASRRLPTSTCDGRGDDGLTSRPPPQILIFCAILLSYGTGTALWLWRRRNDEIAPTLATLLRANGTVTVVGHLDGPRRYDFWGYELRQAVVQTVNEQRPTLHEVELVTVGEKKDGRTEKPSKRDDAAEVESDGWLSAHTVRPTGVRPSTNFKVER